MHSDKSWLSALRITWDYIKATQHKRFFYKIAARYSHQFFSHVQIFCELQSLSKYQISPVFRLVVSTVLSGILFARFSPVKCISKGCSFLLWRHSCLKKVPVETESSLYRGGANLLCGNWKFLKQQMTEENTFENFFQEMCVLETRAQCVREKMK